MRLKILTSTFLVAGVLLMLAWPFAVGARPPVDATSALKVMWGKKALVYFLLTASTWLMTAMSAFLLARQSRKEFLEQERDNLKALIEGTLRDHGKNS